MSGNPVGKFGEDNALLFLENKGYSLVCRNYHSRFGEIDIIVQNDECIVFAEVKQRANNSFANAAEYVDAKKMRKIAETAKQWLSENPSEKQPRFDVIEVYAKSRTDDVMINHIENVFVEYGG